MITRKAYVKITEQIRKELEKLMGEPEARAALRRLAGNIADGFQADNPRFDRERFFAACGFKEGEAL